MNAKEDQKTRCIYCGARTYELSDGRVLCKECKKKSSPKKIQRILAVVEKFCVQTSALTCSKELGISYVSVATIYKKLRSLILLNTQSNPIDLNECDYDEYLFLYKNKKNSAQALFDAYNFLVFAYQDYVYTKPLPPLYRFNVDDESHSKEFARFLNCNRIAKMEKQNKTILKFLEFLETYMSRFRGVENENFIYYLKAAEFLFNNPDNAQQKLRFLLFH